MTHASSPVEQKTSGFAHFVSSLAPARLGVIQLGFVLAVASGMAVAQLGTTALGLVAVPLGGLLLFFKPLLGLYALTLTLPVEDLLPGAGTTTGARLLGMAVFGAWVLSKLIRRESWLRILDAPFVRASILFILWIFTSTLWAGDRALALTGLFTQVQLLFLSLIVIDLLYTWDQAAWLARLLVAAGIYAAVSTIQQYFVSGAIRAGDGISGGINFTASSLVSIMPLAFYLLRTRSQAVWKLVSIIYIALGTVAVAVTFSRTSYIILLLVIGIHYGAMLRHRSDRLWVIAITGLALVVFAWLPREAIYERAQTITPLLSDWASAFNGNQGQTDVRAFHWRVGLAMFEASPLLGMGYNNFGILFLDYQFDVSGLPAVFTRPRSPHSSFIGILSELGIIGIILWLAMLLSILRSLLRAWSNLKREKAAHELFFVQAVSCIFLLQMLYGWALNVHMNKNFWLILGIGAAIGRLPLKTASLHAAAAPHVADNELSGPQKSGPGEERTQKPAKPGEFCPNEACRDFGKLQDRPRRNIVRTGKTRKGIQRFLCKTCLQSFSETTGTFFHRKRTPSQEILEILALLAEGSPIRSLSQAKGHKKNTISTWLREAAQHPEQLEQLLVDNFQVQRSKLDALWTNVRDQNR